jgi:hypothetical protein
MKGIIAAVASVGLFATALAFSGGATPQDRNAIEIAEGVQLHAVDAPAAVAQAQQAQDCSIKGNISTKSGERIPEHVWVDLASAAEAFARQALQDRSGWTYLP